MKKNTIMAVFGIAMWLTASSQITLRFSGRLSNGSYTRMDSVVVENVTHSWSETLTYPDTVLVFQSPTSITGAFGRDLGLQNFPNPFCGTSKVRLSVPENGTYMLRIIDLSGRLLAEKSLLLTSGTSLFEISLNRPQVAIFSIAGKHGQKSIKIINHGKANRNAIAFKGNVQATEKLNCTQPFIAGDSLHIVGYATSNDILLISTPIVQAQQQSQDIQLVFSTNLPTVQTAATSNVTTTSAISGGEVLSSGSSSITAQGVCWSLSQNPTINDSHTSDSLGSSTFTSSITGLTSGTFYYIRAYATNTFGTAYGNETFVLATPETFKRALPGKFSISATEQIQFSKGNLQYTTLGTHITATGDTLEGTWRFAEHQWETIGMANSNISPTYTGWIDLFGWGTSGYHDTNDPYNTCYHPYSYDSTTVYRPLNWWGYGPSLNMPDTNLVGTSANYDWGIFNPISNGGNTPGMWRTLSKDECYYIANLRTGAAQKWGMGSINGIPGVFLLPDNWTTPQGLSFTPGNNSNNTYSTADWQQMENNGAVFLPSGLNRSYTNVGGRAAYYWTSTNYFSQNQNSNLAAFYFVYNVSYFSSGGARRCFGGSVRLVCVSKEEE